MKSSFNISDFYILSWVVMDIVGIFRIYDSLSVLLLGFVLIVAGICDYYIIKKGMTTPYIRALNVLFIMFFIYGALYLFFGETLKNQTVGEYVPKKNYLKYISESILPLFAFYYFSLKGYMTETKMRKWYIIIFVLSFFVFFARQKEVLLEVAGYEGNANLTNNASYLILALFPSLVLFRKKKILFYLGVAFCISLVLLGMKRGAIIIAAVCVIVLLYNKFKFSEKKERYLIIFFSAIFLYFAFKIILKYYEENAFFQLRVSETLEGNSSSRDSLWGVLLNHFINNENLFEQFFGLGADSTLKIGANFAHNDWIEILINQGILGVLVYLYYWFTLYKTWRASKRLPDAFMVIAQVLIVLFLKSIFSMSYGDMHYSMSMIFGFYLAKLKNNENTSCN